MVAARERTEAVRGSRTLRIDKRRPTLRLRKTVDAARPAPSVAPEPETLRKDGAFSRRTCSRRARSAAEGLRSAGSNRAEQLRLMTNRVLAQLAQLAFADIGDVFDARGAVIPFAELPAGVRSAVAEYRVRHYRNGSSSVRVVMRPKVPALAALGAHLGAFSAPEQTDSRLVLAPAPSR